MKFIVVPDGCEWKGLDFVRSPNQTLTESMTKRALTEEDYVTYSGFFNLPGLLNPEHKWGKIVIDKMFEPNYNRGLENHSKRTTS